MIDLDESLQTDSYVPPPVMREQSILINSHCVFPYCGKSSRHTDLDHVMAFDVGGRTITINLAPLCRLHHRVKTHDGWSYHAERPGSYVWRDPLGFSYRVDATGTTSLAPAVFATASPPDR